MLTHFVHVTVAYKKLIRSKFNKKDRPQIYHLPLSIVELDLNKKIRIYHQNSELYKSNNQYDLSSLVVDQKKIHGTRHDHHGRMRQWSHFDILAQLRLHMLESDAEM